MILKREVGKKKTNIHRAFLNEN